jgi:hypothetical protein
MLVRFGALGLILAALFAGLPDIWSLLLGGVGLLGFFFAGGGA